MCEFIAMNKTHIIVLFFTLVTSIMFGQSSLSLADKIKASSAQKLMFAINEEQAIQYAKEDIENELLILHLCSGEAPITITTDNLFQTTYNIVYYEHGCIYPDNELVVYYNTLVLNYLKDKYGKKCMKEMRRDVLGLKK